MRPPVPEVSAYAASLDAAWRAHLAPRTPDAPTVVSLFAGCGGSSLGYAMAGYRELLAVEWDADAAATFRRNFPGVPVVEGDVATLTAQECLDRAGLAPGELDVLDGSPPCQGFSTAGKRALDDPRNGLFREYVRLLRGLRPKAFVLENVAGLVKGRMRLVFADMLRELKGSGYAVSARVLNAMYFGVPQSRARLIVVGVREDLGIAPSHPRAKSRPISVREAILQDGAYFYRSNYGVGRADVRAVPFDRPSLTLTKTIAGGQHVVATGRATAIGQDQPAPPLSPQYLRYWTAARGGEPVGALKACRKLAPDRPSFTLLTSEGNGGSYHPFEPRGLSTGERKRLASFPDPFVFTGWAQAVARIGNSVPPLFMQAIAEHVRTEILDRIGETP